MRLLLDVGHSDGSAESDPAGGGRTLALAPAAEARGDPGTLLACAAGMGVPSGEDSAATALAAFCGGYYGTAEAESSRHALAQGFAAANAAARTVPGRTAVLTALILRGRRWCIGHAGNVRAWRYRDQELRQLTRDHVAPRAIGAAEVTLACGLAHTLEAEYVDGELREGDIFLLTSPAVHETLAGGVMVGILQSEASAQEMARGLVERAIAARAPGDAGACVARVRELPSDPSARENGLRVIDPRPGTEIDGFVIRKLVHKDDRARLYEAEDRESGATVALRFPNADGEQAAQAVLREERLRGRVASPYILETIALRPGRRTALYSVVEHRPSETLARRVRRNRGLAPAVALQLAGQLLAALEALHGQGWVHGDIRARNLFYDRQNGRLWIPGFGFESGVPSGESAALPPAPSYCAPELLAGERASARSDIYAAGVTIYYMLTARYPYGRIRSPEDWKAPRAYRPLREAREGLPRGLDEVLERACAVDPARRYATVAHLTAALDALRAIRSNPASPPGVPGETSDGAERRARWLAAALAAGLLAYLYLTLR